MEEGVQEGMIRGQDRRGDKRTKSFRLPDHAAKLSWRMKGSRGKEQ